MKLRMKMQNVSKRQQPTREQKTAKDHQRVFNTEEKTRNNVSAKKNRFFKIENVNTAEKNAPGVMI